MGDGVPLVNEPAGATFTYEVKVGGRSRSESGSEIGRM